jgi:hypothetical protein
MLRLCDELHSALAPDVVPVSHINLIANYDILEPLALLPRGLELFLSL